MASRPPALRDLVCHNGAAHPEPDLASRERAGRDAAGAVATHVAGIDVRKDTLDAGLLGPDERTRGRRFANDRAEFAALVAWAEKLVPVGVRHFCLEATGPYSEALAVYLHAPAGS